MKPGAQVTLGFIAAAALLWAAVWLWMHNWIVIAAPVGALAVGAAWVGVDNAIIYPAERARRDALAGEPGALAADGSVTGDAPARSDVTVPR